MRLFRLFSKIVLKTVKNVKTWDYQIIWNGRMYVDAFWVCTVGKNPMFDIITNFVSTQISTVFLQKLRTSHFSKHYLSKVRINIKIEIRNKRTNDIKSMFFAHCAMIPVDCCQCNFCQKNIFFSFFACKVVTPNLCFSVWAAPLPDVEQPTISHVAFEWMQFGSRNRKPPQDQAPDPEKSHDLRTSIWMK